MMIQNSNSCNLAGWRKSTAFAKMLLVIACLAVGLFVGFAPKSASASVETYTKADQQATVIRASGDQASDTAAEIAAQAYSSSSWVVIARDDDFADAMSATGLAGTLNAPILLTGREELSENTLETITNLGATNAYIIGGKGAIPGDLESQLSKIGVTNAKRIYGNEYWETSVECANYIKTHGGNPNSEAIVAMGTNFQDALSISSFAYANKIPIFLETDANNGRNLTDAAQSTIWGIVGSNNTIYVPGGPGAVSTQTVEGIFDSEGSSSRVKRMYGNDGFDTSKEIASTLVDEGKLSCDTVIVANGAEGPKGTDALAGAALAGKNNGVVLLANVNSGCGETSTVALNEFLDVSRIAKQVKSAYILGGTYVMPESIVESTEDALWKWAKVTFNANAGSSVDSQTIWDGGKVDTTKTTTTREGYTFANWSTSPNQVGGEVNLSTYKVKESVALYAKWQSADGSETYNVRFNSNGGSDIPAQTVIKGKTATEPTSVARNGYTLDGWYTDAALTEAYDFSSEVTGDVTLYAKWSENLSGVLNVSYNATSRVATAKAQGTQAGAVLNYQWYLADSEGALTPIEGATESTYLTTTQQEASKLVVRATSADEQPRSGYIQGSIIVPKSDGTSQTGSPLTGTVVIEGTPCVGQTISTVVTNAQEDASLSYKWYVVDALTGAKTEVSWTTSSSYTLSANDLGKTVTVEVTDTSRSKYTGTLTASTVVQNNLPISGAASITQDKSGKLTANISGEQEDVSESYQWYTVDSETGVKNAIDGATKRTYTPSAQDAGKKFAVGVSDKSDNPHPGTVYAEYALESSTENTLAGTVTIDGTPAPGQVITAKVSGLQAMAYPTYTWYKIDPSTGVKTLVEGATTRDITLTKADSGMAYMVEVADTEPANYKGTITAMVNVVTQQYTVEFNTRGAEGIPTQTVNCNSYATRPADPTLSGYTFVGWYTNEACTDQFTFDTKITDNVTLYAKWNYGNEATYKVHHFKQNSDGSYPDVANVIETLQGTIGSSTAASVRDFTAEGYVAPGQITFSQNVIASDNTTIIEIYYPLTAYDVVFSANGQGVAPQKQSVLHGACAEEPTMVSVEGYTFYGWFTNAEGTADAKFDFEQPITAPITLEAKWVSDVSGSVFVDGIAAVGETLTAKTEGMQEDFTKSYTWYRGTEVVEGATSSTYTLTEADLGQEISVEIKDEAETYKHVGSVKSELSDTVKNTILTGTVKITGTVANGQTLTVETENLPEDVTSLSYKWFRDGTEIAGQASVTYTPTQADEGHALTVVVEDNSSATPHYGTLTSDPTTKVTRSLIAGTVFINGTPTVGERLTAQVNLDTTMTDVEVAYQWYRDGVAVPGEVRSFYDLTIDDASAEIYVVVTDGSATPHVSSLKSDPTTQVLRVPLVGTVTVEGTPASFETLKATVSGLPSDVTEVKYQWCYTTDAGQTFVQIDGATSSEYTITTDMEGKQLACEVTDGSQTPYSKSITSALTEAVAKPLLTGSIELTPATGAFAVDNQITATTVNLPTGATASYAWYRVSAEGDTTEITGANALTYTPVEADRGCTLVCRVTDSTNTYSSYIEATTDTVVYGANLSGEVSITADTAKLTAVVNLANTQSDVAKLKYQWWRDGVPISGEVDSTYKFDATDDLGSSHTYQVVVTDVTAGTPHASSLESKTISHTMNTPLTGTVTVSGTAKTFETLTAAVTGNQDDASLKYQWCYTEDSGLTFVEIADATSSTYTITTEMAGRQLACVVTDGSAKAYSMSITSALTTAVVKPALTGTVSIALTTPSDAVAVGNELTATVTGLSSHATASYVWCRVSADGSTTTELANSNNSTYTPVEEDRGCTLICRVTDSTSAYSGYIESAKTTVVYGAKLTGTVAIDSSDATKLVASVTGAQSDVTTLSYQWYRGDTAIDGATEATYTFDATDDSGAHEYKVVVTDATTSVTPHAGSIVATYSKTS